MSWVDIQLGGDTAMKFQTEEDLCANMVVKTYVRFYQKQPEGSTAVGFKCLPPQKKTKQKTNQKKNPYKWAL